MPRPKIIGTPVRRIDMHHSSPGKNKDYRITVSEEASGKCRVYTEHGPAGNLNQGKEQTPNPVSLTSALSLADRLRDNKIDQRDSYRVVADKTFSKPSATAPAEDPVQANPDRRTRMFVEQAPEECKPQLAVMF